MDLLWRAQRRNALITWPDAVNERLDQLVAAGLAAGENANRSHLLAALVAHADLSPEFVAKVLRTYRSLSTDALDEANSAAGQWPQARRTGPRRDAPDPAAREDGTGTEHDEDSATENEIPLGPGTPTAEVHP